MKRYIVLVFLVVSLAACGAPPAPTPDAVATQVAQVQAVAATLTADAPTATNTPLPTDTPTATPTPSPTTTPTVTPVPLLTGRPMDYIPTESEMPSGFVVNPNLSVPVPEATYPASEISYLRGLLEIVAYVVVVTPDEEAAKLLYRDFASSPSEMGTITDISVADVDEHISFLPRDGTVAVSTFLRKQNVVAAVVSGGFAAEGAEYYVTLLTQKLGR